MKVVVAHNRYQSKQPSGENAAVDADVTMLREGGVQVVPFIKTNDSLGSSTAKLKAAAGPFWAPASRELAQLLDDEKPDVLHLHNVYPLISPWVIRSAKARGIAVVQTLHNYRHICIEGQRFRDGRPCHDCVGRRWAAPAVMHSCYRGSRSQSMVMALGAGAHQGTWKMVDRFLCVSQAQRSNMADAGWPAERLVVKPNSVPDPGEPAPLGRDVVFLGRLTAAKGVPLLLAAWDLAKPSGRRLVIAGDGPLRDHVQGSAAKDPTIDYVGAVQPADVPSLLARGAVVVVPSVSEETFGLVAVEAMASGRAVLATAAGGLPEVVGATAGWVVDANITALASALSGLCQEQLLSTGRRARGSYLQKFTPDVVCRQLKQVYTDVTTT